jgi:L-fucose mutarotase
MVSGIASIITPEVFEILYRMGYHDELVIADANYHAGALGDWVIYSSVPQSDVLFREVLRYLPLDDDEPHPLTVMRPDYDPYEPEIWERYKKAYRAALDRDDIDLHQIPRADFYGRTRRAYATIQTLEPCLCGNIILRKGVVLV